jgi:hypothetical protein
MPANKFLSATIFTLALSGKAFCQKQNLPVIAAGLSYRQEPTMFSGSEFPRSRYGFYYEVEQPAPYLSLDVKQQLFKKKRIIIELSNYFTYSAFREITPDRTNPYYTIKQKRFKHDHFLSLLYPFKSRSNKPHIILGAGIGYMNFGTGFRYDYFTGESDQSGNPIVYKNKKGGFRFFAPKFIVGIEKSRYNAFLIVNGTPDIYYEPNPTLWIEGKLTYTFHLFDRKASE